MKVWERVVEARLRKVVEICEQQYGFMPRKSTTDAIFALRILMEKYRDGQRELHCVFVDLEKAYDRVPREELWYCMRKSGVAEKYVRVVQDMYERSRTVVRCAVGQTEEFKVEVGLHQGSALSPFLFAIVMDQLSEEVRQESSWTMMFADDIVICSESREQVEENLERWRFALERRGMKVSGSKTEYMCVNEREGSGTVRLQGEEVKKVQEFKYLGSTVQSNGECGKEVKKRVQAGWNGWRKVWGVLCERKISARIKGKVYRTVVRPAMLYGLETVSLRKRQESELEVAELKMLRFSLGVTRLDRIRNEYIRGTAHVGRLGDKVREARLRWFGHVQRREKMDPAEFRRWWLAREPSSASTQTANEQLQQPPPAQVTPRAAATPTDREFVHMALPEKLDGSTGHCFLRQCDNFFTYQPDVYREETTKCAFLLSLLTGRALDWMSAIWDHDPQSRWNDPTTLAVFCEGLCQVLQAEMACRDSNTTLSNYITTTIRLNNLLRQQRHGPHPRSEPQPREEYRSPREEGPEPMQLGRRRNNGIGAASNYVFNAEAQAIGFRPARKDPQRPRSSKPRSMSPHRHPVLLPSSTCPPEYAQNSLTHSSTGLTPFQCILSYQPPLFPWLGEPSDVPAVDDWAHCSQEVWENAHVHLQQAIRRQRIQADRHRRPHPRFQDDFR
ncbi:hypothetical protein QTP70_006716 [Hemibagrus guttatus]|uniref:ribonuclease H n=1 Tax=Hemibagrus guttatus TaxID=175788 RepID=A0AAE0UY88_9TELE|nr:hypothetical protein QTP70_006716 [Hemibagrus guttatus]